MKISVVADRSGKIVGFAHPQPANAARSGSTTSADADAEHTLYVVELSPELAQRAHDDDFADAIMQHQISKKGRHVTLVRASTPAGRSNSAKK